MRCRREICRFLAGAALALSLAACAGAVRPEPSSRAPGLLIEGLVIDNRTEAFVSSARLLIAESGRFVSCGNIAPGASCSTSFPEQRYSGSPVQVDWTQAGHDWSNGPLQLELKGEMAGATRAWVKVTIAGPSLAAVELVRSP